MLALRFVLIAVAALALLTCDRAKGGCSGGACAIGPMVTPAPQPEPEAQWLPCSTYPGCWIYTRGNGSLALFDSSDGNYWLPRNGVFQLSGPALVNVKPLPAAALQARAQARASQDVAGDLPEWMTKGVVDAKRTHEGEKVSYNGRPINKAAAVDVIGRKGGPADIPDDGQRMRVTVIGSDDGRARAAQDLRTHAAFADYRTKWIVQDYRPDEPIVSKAGFRATGNPTIYLTTASGEVLLRCDGYDGPEEMIAKVRRSDPLYDPNKDPDGKPKPPPVPVPNPLAPPAPAGPVTIEIPDNALLGGGLLAVLAGLAWFNRKQEG